MVVQSKSPREMGKFVQEMVVVGRQPVFKEDAANRRFL